MGQSDRAEKPELSAIFAGFIALLPSSTNSNPDRDRKRQSKVMWLEEF